MLASENYAKDVIDRYIDDCAFPAIICKTASRSAVTRLNQFCERVTRFSGCFEPADPFQTILLPILNDDIKMLKNDKERDCYFTYSELERLMREEYGRVFRCRAGVFDVALQLETPCVRRVTIPLDFSLFYVHDVIQHLFLWQNYHIHEFVTKLKNGRPVQCIIDPEQWENEYPAGDCAFLDENTVLLGDIFPGAERIIYIYDFGDEWTHEIRLIEILEAADIPAPVCAEMTGDAPPEDCGGPAGYAELQKALKSPHDPQYRELLEWFRGTDSYQESIQSINSDLRRRYLAGAWDLYYTFSDAAEDDFDF